MKILFTVLLSFVSCFVYGQHGEQDMFGEKTYPIPGFLWSKDYFLSDSFCAAKGLKPLKPYPIQCTWVKMNKDDTATKIERVVDVVQLLLKDRKAHAFLKKNYGRLSEWGDVEAVKMDVPDVSDLMVFHDGDLHRKMDSMFKLHTHAYIVLFRINSFVVKVFVYSQSELTQADVQPFAAEAARRIHAAIK